LGTLISCRRSPFSCDSDGRDASVACMYLVTEHGGGQIVYDDRRGLREPTAITHHRAGCKTRAPRATYPALRHAATTRTCGTALALPRPPPSTYTSPFYRWHLSRIDAATRTAAAALSTCAPIYHGTLSRDCGHRRPTRLLNKRAGSITRQHQQRLTNLLAAQALSRYSCYTMRRHISITEQTGCAYAGETSTAAGRIFPPAKNRRARRHAAACRILLLPARGTMRVLLRRHRATTTRHCR